MSEERKGEAYIFLGGLLWASFPIITILSYRSISSSAALVWSTFFAAIFFAAVMAYKRRWAELRNARIWKLGLLIALFTGVLYYSLMFLGLEFTSPGNVAIIALFEVFSSFLIFNVYKKEAFLGEHILGAVLMVIGAGIVLVRDFSGINIGDFFVLIAACVAPVGNIFQQRARAIASSETVMFVRSVLSVPALAVLAYTLGTHTSFEDLRASLPFLLINGVLLLGLSKIFWVEAIHRISVTKAVALSSLNPFLTIVIAWIVLSQVPNVWQLVSLIPLTLGVLLLTGHMKRTQVRLL